MNFLSLRAFVICFFLLFQSAVINAQTNSSSGYHVITKHTLGGEGGWDYLTVDAQAHRVYISRSTHVMVVNEDSGQTIGDIPNTNGVHGIALVPEFGKGFTSNGRDSTVTVFDLKTLKVLSQIAVGKNPDAILYDPFSKRVLTMNGASRDATAIDAKTGTVAGTIALDGKPEFAVSDERGHVYVNLEDRSIVAELDPRGLKVEARWPIAPGEEPTGLAIDRKHRRLFAGCSNKLMVVLSADDGHVIKSLPIGSGVDATAFDPETQLAFSSNGGDGTLTVIHEDSPESFTVIDNVATQRGARTMALDAKTHRIYLVTAEFGPTPAPTAERPRPRPSIVPGTFTLLIVGRS
ncbi:MAG: YVTN family beta-propeller domain-containing protein [Acidobacteria bacterium 13_1_20CM_3_53_8]|nr:MAG: YVTN family beta-propeller domain-containing protein [Acidobacteria bacterium 13_1_20CM_3_53_8]